MTTMTADSPTAASPARTPLAPPPLPPPPPPAPAARPQPLLHRDDPLRHFIAGAVGGVVATVTLSPLDVLRTRLQAQSSGPRPRPDRMLASIVRTEGVRGLYRGLLSAVLGDGPARALFFGFYHRTKQYLGPDHLGWSGAQLHLGAATVSGLATNTLMSPWWVVRLRLQLQTTPMPASLWGRARSAWEASAGAPAAGAGVAAAAVRLPPPPPTPLPRPPVGSGYTGIIDCFVRIYREEGARALYRGLGASYLGVSEMGIQFALYGRLKDAMLARRMPEAEARLTAQRAAAGLPGPPEQSEVARAAFSGAWAFWASAFCKLIASAASYPFDVVRTRMRERRTTVPVDKYRTVASTFRALWVEEGVRGLYAGLTVHTLRTVPNAAILMAVVETLVGGDV
jgi:solute carrier family 25, member 33/36